MFGRRFKLFKLFGFEVRADWSWLILAALITWTLAGSVFPQLSPGLQPSAYWLMGGLGAIGLFASIVIHEFFHAWTARRRGMAMRGITLFIFGGVAEMGDEPPDAKTEFLVAIAGPIASVLIGGLLLGMVMLFGNFMPDPAVSLLGYLGFINILLAVFNMIPAFPLDGGRILRSAIWHFKGDLRKATKISSSIGSFFGLLLVGFGVYSFITGNLIGGIWYFLLGTFIQNAAAGSYQQVVLRQAIKGQRITEFMKSQPITVEAGATLTQFIEDFVYEYRFRTFPVVDGERLVGIVDADSVKEVPRERWDWDTVSSVTEPASPDNTIDFRSDAWKALLKMQKKGRTRLLVVENDRLVGFLTINDLLHLIQLKMEMGDVRPEVNSDDVSRAA